MLGSITRLGIALLNFSQALLALLGKHVDGTEVVSVLVLFGLFVIHVLSKCPDAGSVNVSKIRMVDSVLEGNVLQVRLFLPLPVEQQLVGVGKDHAFGQRLAIICLLF